MCECKAARERGLFSKIYVYMLTRPGVFKYSEIRDLYLSVRHSAGNADKLLWGHDNNDISDTGDTFMSTHLILATVSL